MRRRDQKINDLKTLVLKKLGSVSKDAKYSELLRFLIAQGLQTLLEPVVSVQCRKEDLSLVQHELEAAVKLFKDNMTKASGITPSTTVTVDTENFLASGSVEGSQGASCAGGVSLVARDGQILCRNTLDHRLDLAFEALKPSIRGALFGVRARTAGAASSSSIHHH